MIEIKFSGNSAEEVLAQIAALTGRTSSATPDPAAPAPVPAAPAPEPGASPAPAVPTTAAPAITLEQLGKAGADLITADPGKMPQLMALLQQFGVPSLQHLRPDQIGACATALRGLGAKI